MTTEQHPMMTQAHQYANIGELEREDTLVWVMLTELHANVPEADRPMGWCDLSDDQADRARKAVRAILAALTTTQAAEDAAYQRGLEDAIKVAIEEREYRQLLKSKADKKSIARDYETMAIACVHVAAAIRALGSGEGKRHE